MGPELHWYFSFGANMSRRVLQQCGVATAQSVPGLLPDWQLRFDYVGYDGVEPRFANVAPRTAGDAAVPVHGVAHQLDASGLAALDDIEDQGVSYRRVRVAFEAYDGRELEAWAYVGVPEWLSPGVPSARYLKVLTEGARAHGLRRPYVEWLVAHPCLDFSEACQQGACSPALGSAGTPCAGGPLDLCHRPGDTAAGECGTLRIAGEAFHVPLAVLRQRSFLRSMVRDGGTVFALRTLRKAYAEEAEGGRRCEPIALREDDFRRDAWAEGLSELQVHYVACWRRYLEARFSRAAPSP